MKSLRKSIQLAISCQFYTVQKHQSQFVSKKLNNQQIQYQNFCSLTNTSETNQWDKEILTQLLQDREWTQQQQMKIKENKQMQINLLQELLKLEKYSGQVDYLCQMVLHQNGGQLSGSDIATLTYLCCSNSSIVEKQDRLMEGLAFFTNKMAYDFNPKQLAMILQAHASVDFQYQLLHRRLANATIYRMSEMQLEDVAVILGALAELKVECVDLQEIAIEWSQYQLQDAALLNDEGLLEFLWGILWNQKAAQNIPWISPLVQRLPIQFDNQQSNCKLQQVLEKLQDMGITLSRNKGNSQ